MITGICMVIFETLKGERMQVNMDAREFAHLVSEHIKKTASIFPEQFTFEKDGITRPYKWFGLRKKYNKGFLLEYSV